MTRFAVVQVVALDLLGQNQARLGSRATESMKYVGHKKGVEVGV